MNTTNPTLKLAQKLYNECPTVKPTWDQLMHNGPTQSVWIERAKKQMFQDLQESLVRA